nr:MAG TPA: hypothetical protein [Caudoviricetes sp.]
MDMSAISIKKNKKLVLKTGVSVLFPLEGRNLAFC